MACGTPVIAYDRGSMAELIDQGVTGYLVRDVAGACRSVDVAARLDRGVIRAAAVARFNRSTMVEAYANLYHRVLCGRP